jgi:hypothetical protein
MFEFRFNAMLLAHSVHHEGLVPTFPNRLHRIAHLKGERQSPPVNLK